MPAATEHPLAHHENRLTELRTFLERLRNADVNDDKTFQALFYQAQLLLEMPDLAIAEALLVSRPTVNRWVRGKNLPHRALRQGIISWIEHEITRRAQWLKDQLGVATSRGQLTTLLAVASQ